MSDAAASKSGTCPNGHQFPVPDWDGTQPMTCPTCGETVSPFGVVFDAVQIRVGARVTAKDDSYPSKSKVRIDQKFGFEPSQKTDTGWAPVRRTIDKNEDIYEEEVCDEAGNVIHRVKEPLSKHQGHGSAKDD